MLDRRWASYEEMLGREEAERALHSGKFWTPRRDIDQAMFTRPSVLKSVSSRMEAEESESRNGAISNDSWAIDHANIASERPVK